MRKGLLSGALLVALTLVIAGCGEEGPTQTTGPVEPMPTDPLPLLEKEYQGLKAAVEAGNVEEAKRVAVKCRQLAFACQEKAGEKMAGGGPGTGVRPESRQQALQVAEKASAIRGMFVAVLQLLETDGLTDEVKAEVVRLEQELGALRVMFEERDLTTKKAAVE